MLRRILQYGIDNLKGHNVIYTDGKVLLERRYVVRTRFFGIYLHKCLHPDTDSDLYHDHPWSWSFSIILSGHYIEERPGYGTTNHVTKKKAFQLNYIGRDTFHRISEISEGGAITIYCRGKRIKQDGFMQRLEDNTWKYHSAQDVNFEYTQPIP